MTPTSTLSTWLLEVSGSLERDPETEERTFQLDVEGRTIGLFGRERHERIAAAKRHVLDRPVYERRSASSMSVCDPFPKLPPRNESGFWVKMMSRPSTAALFMNHQLSPMPIDSP